MAKNFSGFVSHPMPVLDIFSLPGAPSFEIEISSKQGVFGLHLCRCCGSRRVGFGREKDREKAPHVLHQVLFRG